MFVESAYTDLGRKWGEWPGSGKGKSLGKGSSQLPRRRPSRGSPILPPHPPGPARPFLAWSLPFSPLLACPRSSSEGTRIPWYHLLAAARMQGQPPVPLSWESGWVGRPPSFRTSPCGGLCPVFGPWQMNTSASLARTPHKPLHTQNCCLLKAGRAVLTPCVCVLCFPQECPPLWPPAEFLLSPASCSVRGLPPPGSLL